jgi:hypothetical protein
MRKLITSLSVALVVIALTACGGSDKKIAAATDSSTSGSTSSSSTSSSSGDKKVSGDFCQQIAQIDPANVADDPTGAKKAVATLKQLDPPSEIKDEWDDYIAAIDEIANTDPKDSAKLASIAQAHLQSFTKVGLYISQSCLSAFSGSIPSFSS